MVPKQVIIIENTLHPSSSLSCAMYLEKMGIKVMDAKPLATIWFKISGIIKPTRYASTSGPAPHNAAIIISLTSPIIRLKKTEAIIIAEAMPIFLYTPDELIYYPCKVIQFKLFTIIFN
jgi:hypothetical protein